MNKGIFAIIAGSFLNLLVSMAYGSTDLLGCKENCRKTITWTGCGISKQGFMKELANVYGKQHQVTFALSGGGATKGIRDVVKGDAHMGGMCRLPLLGSDAGIVGSDDEQGVEQEKDSLLIPMGWDALVVILHKDNPINDLQLDELKDILTGKITDWSQLKDNQGKKGKFNLYIRQGRLSGVGRSLRQTLFDNTHENFVQTAAVKKSSGEIEKAVAEDVNGIAVSGFSSANKRDGLKLLSLNGYDSTINNLAAGKYPIYRILILTLMKESLKDPDIGDFVEYARSREAAEVIKKAGTLPFTDGLSLSSKLKDAYLMEIFELETSGRYNPSKHNLEKWRLN
ncbi:MAG: substrate-binding domain-containing protein [Gammaproteobacteria bacterium]|nr:substrate-binding domain-containing protein [Gammaproteobacteria bacterium]